MTVAKGNVKGQRDGAIGWIIFDNPGKLNAISPAMRAQAYELASSYERDAAVRVVVMRGEGDKAFVSGADISSFDDANADASGSSEPEVSWSMMSNKIKELTKPTIVMIHGYCLGGGLELALNADIRFASTLSQWGIPAALRGIAYPPHAVQQLLTVVTPSVAKDILYSGRRLTAFEALNVGLANQIYSPEKLVRETTLYAQTIAENAPLSVQSAKFSINQFMLEPSLRDHAAMEAKVEAATHSKDYREGTLSFMEKRKPMFLGV
jgi:enoyl-CoA hydratase